MNKPEENPKLALTIPWEEIESGAQSQIIAVLGLPFLKRLAIMPDVHQGYDLCIGGVALLDSVISPTFVGMDIGCGMRTSIFRVAQNWEWDSRMRTMEKILRSIPVGFNSHKRSKPYRDFSTPSMSLSENQAVNAKLKKQLGTLGGGNHFIEIGEDKGEDLGITIHSGSRGAGAIIAKHFIALAKTEHPELGAGFFPLDSDLGQEYLKAMHFMTRFALDNRDTMMLEVMEVMGLDSSDVIYSINENHNFASIESNGVLHRKGATPAEKGKLGVIPANMSHGVYITEGLGNEDFLNCASHGAGRVMSRTMAKKVLDGDVFANQMEGICYNHTNCLDEAPDAYKPIEDVIERQEGVLIDVVNHIKPKIVIKG